MEVLRLTTEEAFPYDQLPDAITHIRLLNIDRSDDDDEIVCNLSTYCLDKAPQYAAISYCWGEPHPAKRITVNQSPVCVGPNCHYALLQARHCQECEYYWLDTLCIDQSNLKEKGHQVQMVGQIFARALCVYASLGEHADESQYIVEALRGAPPLSDTEISSDRVRLWIKHVRPLVRANVPRWQNALLHLGRRSYWSRLWIVQELIIAPRRVILCGSDTIGSYAFRRLFDEAFYKVDMTYRRVPPSCQPSDIPGQSRSMPSAEFCLDNDLPMETILNLLSGVTLYPHTIINRLRHLQCRHQLDRIYRLLALIGKDPVSEPFLPDYSISGIRLAIKCVSWFLERTSDTRSLPFQTLKQLIDYLQLDKQDQPLQEMLSQRKKVSCPPAKDEPSFAYDKNIPTIGLEQRRKFVLSEDSGPHWLGFQLRQNLPRSAPRSAEFSPGYLMRNVVTVDFNWRFPIDLIQDTQAALDYMNGLSDSTEDLPLGLQKFHVHGHLSGVICSSAKHGDYILQPSESIYTQSKRLKRYLVVRKVGSRISIQNALYDSFRILGVAWIHPSLEVLPRRMISDGKRLENMARSKANRGPDVKDDGYGMHPYLSEEDALFFVARTTLEVSGHHRSDIPT